jgi:hypothetical protein
MWGSRSILASHPEAVQIQDAINLIESAVSDNSSAAFDVAKSIIEVVCKTILGDFGITINPSWECPVLLKQTLKSLTLVPDGSPVDGRFQDGAIKVSQGIANIVHGLCEMRNSHGLASHGRDAFDNNMGLNYTLFAARAADAVASFLWLIHKNQTDPMSLQRFRYEDHMDFNGFIDESTPVVQIGEIVLSPSEVLYKTDPEAYRSAVLEYAESQVEEINQQLKDIRFMDQS